jgi:hypothetical protein
VKQEVNGTVILPALVFPAIELHMGSDGSTVVELSPHHPKVEGSSPSVDREYTKKGVCQNLKKNLWKNTLAYFATKKRK